MLKKCNEEICFGCLILTMSHFASFFLFHLSLSIIRLVFFLPNELGGWEGNGKYHILLGNKSILYNVWF